jgi:hypothetical protein
MIKRTYVVGFPVPQRTSPNFVDICVRAPMGTRTLPVANSITFGPNVTPPPPNWIATCGDAAYYEIRGRTLSFEHLFAAGAAGGFTERAHLGFDLIVTPYGMSWAIAQGFSPPAAQLSQSLLAAVGGDFGNAVPATNLADPTYGVPQPVIRISVPRVGQTPLMGLAVLVHLNIAERKDEDFSSVGGV